MKDHILILTVSLAVAISASGLSMNSFFDYPLPSLLLCTMLTLYAYFIYEKEFAKNNNNKENAQ